MSPGSTRAATQPTPSSVPRTTASHTRVAACDVRCMSAKITLSCDEHGMPSASSSVTSIRSLRVSMMRAVSVAIVSHPRPSTIGSTALPLSPMPRRIRLDMTARRGR